LASPGIGRMTVAQADAGRYRRARGLAHPLRASPSKPFIALGKLIFPQRRPHARKRQSPAFAALALAELAR